jgi:hypothetical protein
MVLIWKLLALVPKQGEGDLTTQGIYLGAFNTEASCRKAAAQNQHRDGVLWICQAVTPNSDGGEEHWPLFANRGRGRPLRQRFHHALCQFALFI